MIKKFTLLLLAIMLMFTSAYSLDENLYVAQYEFEQNLLDSTINGFGGSFSGGTANYTNDSIQGDYSLYLNNDAGETELVNLPFDAGVFTETMSVSVWFNLQQMPNAPYGYGILNNDVNGNRGHYFDFYSGGLAMGVRNNANQLTSIAYANSSLPGQWVHYAMVYDNGNLSMWVDGELIQWQDNLYATGGIRDNNVPFDIGRQQYDGNANRYFKGALDNLIVSTEVWTESDIQLLANGTPPAPIPIVNIMTQTPIDLQNFTFDVESTPLEIMTNINSTCSYTYNNVSTPMTTSDNINHSIASFNMGTATNSTKSFTINYYCEQVGNSTINDTTSITFYQNQVPLGLTLYVPLDMQTFDAGTSQIQFHIETNYQAVCEYLVYNMTAYENFSMTNSNIHKTNYTSFYPNVFEYNTSFVCEGTILNETTSQNLTFYLLEEVINGGNNVSLSNSLTRITGQLPQVGSDTSGFIDGVRNGAVPFIFALAFIVLVGSLMGAIVFMINTFTKDMVKKK